MKPNPAQAPTTAGARPRGRRRLVSLSLLLCAGLMWPVAPVEAMQRSSQGRSAPQRSAPQRSAPQRSAPQRAPQRSAPQRSAPQRSAPQRSPQRSAPQRSAPQRSPQRSVPQRSPVIQRSSPQRSVEYQRSAPQRSEPQRSAPAPQRSAPAPQRSEPQRSAPQPQRSSPTPRSEPQRSVPVPQRPEPQRSIPAPSRGSEAPVRSAPSYDPGPSSAPSRGGDSGRNVRYQPEPSGPSGVPAPTPPSRGWTPAPSTAEPGRASEGRPAVSDPRTIDLGEAYVRPRTPVPAINHRPRPEDLRSDVPGARPSLPYRSRTTTDPSADAAAARGTLIRERSVTRGDILERYRGSDSAAGDAASVEGRVRDARISEARRAAAAKGAAGTDAVAGRDARGEATPGRSDGRGPGARPIRGTPTREDVAVATKVRAARADYVAALSTKAPMRPAVPPPSDAAADLAPDRGRGDVRGGTPPITSGPPAHGGAPITTAGHGGHHGHGHGHHGSIHFGHQPWSHYYNSCYWDTWGGHFSPFHCTWWWGPLYACGYWWNSYWYCGGYWSYRYRPHWYWYGPFVPISYSIVVYDEPEVIYLESEPEVVYLDAAPPVEGEATVAPEEGGQLAPPVPSGSALNRAADYYLTLGDNAFRDGRFADAVHYYAKAVEFAPDEGILYLVLSDALFATGDYKYSAYALRQALQKDPGLASQVVDKHSFYATPATFDEQVAVLERYLEDHFLDDDARLVLAANYVFGGRPIDAIQLLESPFSEALRGSHEGTLLLATARKMKEAR